MKHARIIVISFALLAFALTTALAAAAPPSKSTAAAQASEEWDGTAPPPSGGALVTTHEYDVAAGNGSMTVAISWDPGPALAYDLDLYVERLVGGSWTEVDSSTDSQLLGGEATEKVVVATPEAGHYRAAVANYASTELAYHGSISYTAGDTSTTGGGKGGKGGGGKKAAGDSPEAWTAPLRVAPETSHGYEPAVYSDHFGNLFATAHKENWQLLLGADQNSPTQTRSMSYAWYSDDNGSSFHNLPGLTALSLEQHDFGDEGDMAVDDANHLYFVDTNVADVTFTSWDIHGLGQYALTQHRPVLPAGEPVDDRPWVIAHGDGHVFYFGNEGDKFTYGPGRYTVYSSYDGGQTFDSVGQTLEDSGWCRPAADHTAPYSYVYAICTNDEGTLYAYVSADDGESWTRNVIGTYNSADPYQSWPTVEVAPDGSLWALYVDYIDSAHNKLRLFHSTDHGQTWSSQDITPMPGRYEYGWLSVARDGSTLGLGVYYRPDNASDWYVYGASFAPGTVPALVRLDSVSVQAAACDEAPGDLLGSTVGPDGKVSVVWTRNTDPTTCGTLTVRDIYYARTQ